MYARVPHGTGFFVVDWQVMNSNYISMPRCSHQMYFSGNQKIVTKLRLEIKIVWSHFSPAKSARLPVLKNRQHARSSVAVAKVSDMALDPYLCVTGENCMVLFSLINLFYSL